MCVLDKWNDKSCKLEKEKVLRESSTSYYYSVMTINFGTELL